jgi:hypothetical protein
MRRLLRALAGIGITDLNELHNRLWLNIIVSLAVIFGGIVLNYNGHGIIDVYLFWFLFLTTFYIWSRPEILAILTAIETIRRAANLAAANGTNANVDTDGVTKNVIALAPAFALMWLSIVFMFVATLPLSYFMSFGKALTTSLIALLCISVIGWTSFFKWTTTVIYKKVIVAYAAIGLIVCVIQIPLYFGANAVYGKAGTSKSAKHFNKMTYAVKETNDADFESKMDGIEAEYKACKGIRSCLKPKTREIVDAAERLTGEFSPDFSQPVMATYSKKPVTQDPKPNLAPAATSTPAPEPQKDSGANKITISGKYNIHATMVEAAKKYGQKNPLEVDMLVTTSTHEGDTVKFVTQENIYTCQLQPNGDCDGQWSPKGKSNGQPLHFHFHSDERADGWIMDGGLKADAIIYGI